MEAGMNENSRCTAEDIARRGREIYEHHIRRKVEPEYDGKVLAIDVVTGELLHRR